MFEGRAAWLCQPTIPPGLMVNLRMRSILPANPGAKLLRSIEEIVGSIIPEFSAGPGLVTPGETLFAGHSADQDAVAVSDRATPATAAAVKLETVSRARI